MELVDVYDLKGKLIGSQSRDEFYAAAKKEFQLKGKISKQLKTIRVLLLNSNGKIYLQKRSKTKNENPGLYDKTVGGHVSSGDSYNITFIRECAEELGFPSTIVSETEFDKALKGTNLSIVGVFRLVEEVSNYDSTRVSKSGETFVQPYISANYIGYYDGAIRFLDGESSGIEVFSLEELKQEIRENPKKFTEDIKFFIKKYEKFIRPLN